MRSDYPIATDSPTISRALPGARECGSSRDGGAIYAECGVSSDAGLTVEDCLMDYPYVVPDDFAPNRGVRLFERDGIWHIVDRIGQRNYPTPDVFLEEVRTLGLSRKLPGTLDFSKLGPGSMIFMVHPRGWVNEWQKFRAFAPIDYGAKWKCPLGLHEHCPPLAQGCCAGIWWENSWWGGPVEMLEWKAGERKVHVHLACGHGYEARRPPWAAAEKLTFSSAIIARFPITTLAVPMARNGDHMGAFLTAQRGGVPAVISDY